MATSDVRQEIEVRAYHCEELRVVEAEGQPSKIEGYAAVFGLPSEDLGGFREIVRPGAFKKTLGEADVRGLVNHDPNYVLGRTKSGTLSLKEDIHGLRMTLEPPDTQYARDLMASMKRGDVDQMSFGFTTVRDEWLYQNNEETGKEEIVRTLIEVKLFDVSIVTFPAYPQTTAQVRSRVSELQQVNAAPVQADHPAEPTAEQQAQARLSILRRQLDIAEAE